jgi:dCMP deaminase
MYDFNKNLNNPFKPKRPHIYDTMLSIAAVIAERSTCARRAVGCVLVDKDNRVLSIGHNGPARGMTHCTETPCEGAGMASGTGLELCQAIHAEQNALMFCNDIMKIDKCFVTVSPCVHCIKMLMNTGCKTIIFAGHYAHNLAAENMWKQDPTRRWISAPDPTKEAWIS